jgi:glycosyltransferase involved in cell wall biosynthesis
MPPKYSVVVPLHNEESSIRELYARLSDVMTGRYEPVEFVFVDDHSLDGTALILAELRCGRNHHFNGRRLATRSRRYSGNARRVRRD